MKDGAFANGTIEPTFNKIEAEYQCRFALRCTAGLQFPTFMTGITSSIISHALNVNFSSQLTEASDHWSAGTTSIMASHLGSSSLTGFPTHRNFSHEVCWASLV